jgi:hypothetical protein
MRKNFLTLHWLLPSTQPLPLSNNSDPFSYSYLEIFDLWGIFPMIGHESSETGVLSLKARLQGFHISGPDTCPNMPNKEINNDEGERKEI